jgi:hypothetical protein
MAFGEGRNSNPEVRTSDHLKTNYEQIVNSKAILRAGAIFQCTQTVLACPKRSLSPSPRHKLANDLPHHKRRN